MAKTQQKEKARLLRSKGKSIADIAKELQASKSSVSYWCRDIRLTPQQLSALRRKSAHAGRSKFIELGEQKRNQRLLNISKQRKIGSSTVAKMSSRDLYFLGLGLYWGEGYKESNDEFGFTNSDPVMICTYIEWLKKCFNISRDNLILRVSINALHKKREGEIISYWEQKTKVPRTQFTKTSFIKAANKKVYSSKKKYYGVLRIKVRKGMNYKYQILGAISDLN